MFFVGLDLGQAQDYTAVIVIERDQKQPVNVHPETVSQAGMKARPAYNLRHIERFPLNTPYTRIAKGMKKMMTTPEMLEGSCLIVDATGVGKAVVDLLTQEGLFLYPVTITGGEKVNRDGNAFTVPKRDLVAVLQVLLQNERLQISAELPLAQTLVKELLDFKMKIDARTAHESFGAWREGAHDDLVLATALAAWYAETFGLPLDLDGIRSAPREGRSIRGFDDDNFSSRGLRDF